LNVYQTLYEHFGPQHWWPGESVIEIIIGAILTQNTAWSNVERAIVRLKDERVLSVRGLLRIREDKLAGLIRSAGYYNQKARKVKAFMCFLQSSYGSRLCRLGKERAPILRDRLLEVHGIGPETADSIMLYAFNKPVFVIDAYTRRIFSRLGFIGDDASYDEMQRFFTEGLPKRSALFNEYHALIVRMAKEYCKTTPRCEQCPLASSRCRGKSGRAS
jgi:endonuclease-3 related protein